MGGSVDGAPTSASLYGDRVGLGLALGAVELVTGAVIEGGGRVFIFWASLA